MPIEYFLLRYHNGVLWFLQSFDDRFVALAEYKRMKSTYRGSKIQLKQCVNNVVSTLFETIGG